jgi:hypothetical protein
MGDGSTRGTLGSTPFIVGDIGLRGQGPARARQSLARRATARRQAARYGYPRGAASGCAASGHAASGGSVSGRGPLVQRGAARRTTPRYDVDRLKKFYSAPV